MYLTALDVDFLIEPRYLVLPGELSRRASCALAGANLWCDSAITSVRNYPMMKRKMGLPARTAFVCLAAASLTGCLDTADEANENEAVESPFQVADKSDPDEGHDPVLESLAAAGDWELAHVQAELTNVAPPPQFDELSEFELDALTEQAENDPAWYASDGERYEALYVTSEGVVYGRRGPAPEAKAPDAANNYGSFEGAPAPAFNAHQPPPGGPGDRPDDFAVEGTGPVHVEIGTDSTNDIRGRQSSLATLQSFPFRVVGAMSGNGNTGSSGCSGAKIAPRAVLTASHCVLTPAGAVQLNGFFNPGQTNTTTPNGSIAWNGVFLQDWRIHRKWDYAVVFLADSAAMVGLGHMGVTWWTSATGYNGKHSANAGYPCGPNGPANCGTIAVQTCNDSPRADKRCDGWMYGSGAVLNTASFMADDLLKFYNDLSKGHSGSPVWMNLTGGGAAVLAVATHSDGIGTDVMGPRFRQVMWDDVCSWIGMKPSTFGTHPCQ